MGEIGWLLESQALEKEKEISAAILDTRAYPWSFNLDCFKAC